MDAHTTNVLSLCSGAGGLDLGVGLAVRNARTVCYVEIEAYACEILATRMEEKCLDEAPIWSNLRTFDGTAWRGLVDVLIGGYPCQPFSVAGKMLGDQDPRHLWPEVARIAGEAEVPLLFFENVGHHLRIGFREVARELHHMGYRVAAGLFTAEEIGAPHKRERLFIMAHREGSERGLQLREWGPHATLRKSRGCGEVVAEAVAEARDGQLSESRRGSEGRAGTGSAGARSGAELGDTNLTRSQGRSGSLREREDELPAWPPSPADLVAWGHVLERWPEVEPALCGMVDGMAHRVDRLRLTGNGVVPDVAAFAFRTLHADLFGE